MRGQHGRRGRDRRVLARTRGRRDATQLVLFGSTQPQCTLDGDRVTYDCTLQSAPTFEGAGGDTIEAHYGRHGYVGDRQLLSIDGRVAGGCIGQNATGTRWSCYLGDEAVKHDVFIEGFLGKPLEHSELSLFTLPERLGPEQLRALEAQDW